MVKQILKSNNQDNIMERKEMEKENNYNYKIDILQQQNKHNYEFLELIQLKILQLIHRDAQKNHQTIMSQSLNQLEICDQRSFDQYFYLMIQMKLWMAHYLVDLGDLNLLIVDFFPKQYYSWLILTKYSSILERYGFNQSDSPPIRAKRLRERSFSLLLLELDQFYILLVLFFWERFKSIIVSKLYNQQNLCLKRQYSQNNPQNNIDKIIISKSCFIQIKISITQSISHMSSNTKIPKLTSAAMTRQTQHISPNVKGSFTIDSNVIISPRSRTISQQFINEVLGQQQAYHKYKTKQNITRLIQYYRKLVQFYSEKNDRMATYFLDKIGNLSSEIPMLQQSDEKLTQSMARDVMLQSNIQIQTPQNKLRFTNAKQSFSTPVVKYDPQAKKKQRSKNAQIAIQVSKVKKRHNARNILNTYYEQCLQNNRIITANLQQQRKQLEQKLSAVHNRSIQASQAFKQEYGEQICQQ